MKKMIYFTFFFLAFSYLGAFGQKPTCKDSTLLGMLNTPDKLYWDKQQYVVAKSFLATFNGYKKIYPEIPILTSILGDEFGKPTETNYYPIWLLQDSVLYLREIEIYNPLPSKQKLSADVKYSRIENMTGEYFTKNKLEKGIRPPESPAGTMAARWVNGSFYVKKKAASGEYTRAWENAPFVKFTFKNGKLISATEVYL